MKIYVPNYYREFKCIAEKCRDNCCIGWGIDIDENTLERYKVHKGKYSEELLSTIDFSSGGSFICDSLGRCKNLDCDGLCKIIKNLGEGYLCQICRDHPRYFNCEYGRCEGGLGLACEEAARMILALDRLPEIVETESEEVGYLFEDESLFAFCARDYLLEVAFDENLSATDKLMRLMSLAFHTDELLFGINCGTCEDSAFAKEMLIEKPTSPLNIRDFITESLGIFTNLDLLTEDFGTGLSAALTAAKEKYEEFIAFLDGEGKSILSPLLYYFIHRYFLSAEGHLLDNMWLCIALALAVAAKIFASDKSTAAAIVAKDFSKNIEYSTDNISMLIERIENIPIYLS